jgi:hypothetical protein
MAHATIVKRERDAAVVDDDNDLPSCINLESKIVFFLSSSFSSFSCLKEITVIFCS